MKKFFKRNVHGGSSSAGGTDTDNLLYKINQRLEFLEKKIDTLISQRAGADAVRPERPSLRRDESVRDRGEAFPENRELTRVKCAECGDECTVPFKPVGDRPVYCRACFSKQKDNFSPREKFSKRGKPEFHYKKNRR